MSSDVWFDGIDSSDGGEGSDEDLKKGALSLVSVLS
jgi:hypothetical protein